MSTAAASVMPVSPLVAAITPSPTGMVAAPAVFFALGLVLFALRIQTRRASRALALDDFFLASAVVLDVLFFMSYLVSIRLGAGPYYGSTPADKRKTYTIWDLVQNRLYAYGIAFIKLAIAWQLMRVKSTSMRWRIGMWVMIFVVVAMLFISEIINWLQARPTAAFWDPTVKGAKYLPMKEEYAWSYFYSAWSMFTDVVYALAPILFIRKMNQPLREKLILCALFALGLLCSVCGAPRFIVLTHPSLNAPRYETAAIEFWSLMEFLVGIIAVCILALRSKFDSFMRSLGLITGDSRGSRGSRGWSWQGGSKHKTSMAAVVPAAQGQSPTSWQLEAESSSDADKRGDSWVEGKDDFHVNSTPVLTPPAAVARREVV